MSTMRSPERGFTLAELLVSMSILTVLVLLVARMLDSAASVTTSASKRIDSDSQARPLLDRIAVDVAHMIKRPDVNYHFKSSGNQMAGNDLLAFYTTVSGYSSGGAGPLSVVAYRVNSDTNVSAFNQLERMGRGLPWGASASGDMPMVFLPQTLAASWPSIASSTNYDSPVTYEVIGPQVFRFEYYFVERTSGALTPYPSGWTSAATVAIKDVSALVVALAIIEPRSRQLLSNQQLTSLAGKMSDCGPNVSAGGLVAQWQAALDGVTDMPRPALTGVRLYERHFYIAGQ